MGPGFADPVQFGGRLFRVWRSSADRGGADQYGFSGETWTYKRVADLIRREFNVSYSERHVGRLLKRGSAGNLERRIE